MPGKPPVAWVRATAYPRSARSKWLESLRKRPRIWPLSAYGFRFLPRDETPRLYRVRSRPTSAATALTSGQAAIPGGQAAPQTACTTSCFMPVAPPITIRRTSRPRLARSVIRPECQRCAGVNAAWPLASTIRRCYDTRSRLRPPSCGRR